MYQSGGNRHDASVTLNQSNFPFNLQNHPPSFILDNLDPSDSSSFLKINAENLRQIINVYQAIFGREYALGFIRYYSPFLLQAGLNASEMISCFSSTESGLNGAQSDLSNKISDLEHNNFEKRKIHDNEDFENQQKRIKEIFDEDITALFMEDS